MGLLRRYERLLPLAGATPRLSLEEGGTPLVRCGHLGRALGIDLYAKFDGMNPTGSFKDRGMVLAVSKALEEGAGAVVCASTGNTSASAAAYAAHAGIPCYVLLPAGNVAMGKLAQALLYGAQVVAVRGNFDRALELARRASDQLGLAIVNSVNRFRLWGQRSAAWEICDELGDAPEWLAIPVGNAGNITAYWAGFVQYRRIGMTSRVPQMMGFQAEGASPMVTGRPVDTPETVATAIRIGRPVNAAKARWAARMSGGAFGSVSDREILAAQRELASREGIFAEPASCAPLAGLKRLAERGELPAGKKVVMVLTGNGLKDPQAVIDALPAPREIDDSWDALKGVLGR
ncbi:MAG: threonine synthase [Synergistales bacterium]|nr:threonine synthase [Synergistales bacterium]